MESAVFDRGVHLFRKKMVVVMTNKLAQAFIIFSIIICNWKGISCTSTEEQPETVLEDYLICRSCGADAAISNFIISKLSPKSLVANNETVFRKDSVLVQVIENPLGIQFEVVVLKRANCARLGFWNSSFSWFPGFSWKPCLCNRCAAHIGWMFEPVETATKSQIFPSEAGFYLMIVDSVIAETDLKTELSWHPSNKV